MNLQLVLRNRIIIMRLRFRVKICFKGTKVNIKFWAMIVIVVNVNWRSESLFQLV
jgi:hypothetical protein